MASPHELGVPRSTVYALFGALYPLFVRGNAYLALGRVADAEAEFRRIIDDRTIVASDPMGVLAPLQLGRALALAGDTAQAHSAYQAFLALWHDADPDIPVLRQAQVQIARMP